MQVPESRIEKTLFLQVASILNSIFWILNSKTDFSPGNQG